jgi:hypothetical protein
VALRSAQMRVGTMAEAILRKKYRQAECMDGFHEACLGTHPQKGKIGTLCWCECHRKEDADGRTQS